MSPALLEHKRRTTRQVVLNTFVVIIFVTGMHMLMFLIFSSSQEAAPACEAPCISPDMCDSMDLPTTGVDA